jgi:hypothetical protein
MSGKRGHMGKRIAGTLAFAYRTLVLYILYWAAFIHWHKSGGWVNYLAVAVILTIPIALVPLVRRMRKVEDGG